MLLEINHLEKVFRTRFSKEETRALQDVDFKVDKGEFIAIMGESGSGKTTLLNILATLEKPTNGSIFLNGTDVTKIKESQLADFRLQNLGFVFQDFNLIEQATVEENVRLPLLYRGLTPRQTHTKVKQALEKVGLGDKLEKYPRHLSGGQKQRVAIARALVNSPKFIIADEPTGALDSKTSASIMDILYRLNREDGVTIVMVTHDPTLTKYCSRVIHVIDGVIHEQKEGIPHEI